jgi:hypothetical protein
MLHPNNKGRIMIRSLSVFLSLSLYVPAAFSWGNTGHQTIGEIAERFLTPEAKMAITDILGPEKLAIAATWADAVRDDPAFNNFKSYHFIDIEENASYETAPHAAKDSMTIITKYPLLLASKEVNRSVKIVALKYLIHVVGDIHQPLHVGSETDQGGNKVKVNWNNQPANLHEVWDSKLIDYDISKLKVHVSPLKFYTFINYADDIIKNHPLEKMSLEKIQMAPPLEWIKESQNLRSTVYNFEGTSLNENYKEKNIAIIEERLLFGGVRLANLVNAIFKDGTNPGLNNGLSKAQILEQLNLSNQ